MTFEPGKMSNQVQLNSKVEKMSTNDEMAKYTICQICQSELKFGSLFNTEPLYQLRKGIHRTNHAHSNLEYFQKLSYSCSFDCCRYQKFTHSKSFSIKRVLGEP